MLVSPPGETGDDGHPRESSGRCKSKAHREKAGLASYRIGWRSARASPEVGRRCVCSTALFDMVVEGRDARAAGLGLDLPMGLRHADLSLRFGFWFFGLGASALGFGGWGLGRKTAIA